MQVSRGAFRGLKLNTLAGSQTRPTTQKVKEAIFNMLAAKIADSVVLDVFSGSGALGIECLSMGAKQVYFNDSSKQACQIIKSNVIKLPAGNYQLFNLDYHDLFALMTKKKIQFDLIILDPPYHLHIIAQLINLIMVNNLLNKNGIIVVESSHKESAEIAGLGLKIIKDKKYGQTRILVYQYLEKEE